MRARGCAERSRVGAGFAAGDGAAGRRARGEVDVFFFGPGIGEAGKKAGEGGSASGEMKSVGRGVFERAREAGAIQTREKKTES